MMATLHDVVVIGAARTPIGRFGGALASVPATDLGATAARAALERSGLDGALVDEVVFGNVVSAGLGQAPARQVSIRAGIPSTASASMVNKVCASGLEAINQAARSILEGDARVVVAGGMESMSRAPYLVPGAREGLRLGNAALLDANVNDGLWCPFEQHHMGNAAELIAERHGISRVEMDEFSLQSHRKAVAAAEAGRFDREIVSIEVAGRKGPTVVTRDEGPRADASIETL